MGDGIQFLDIILFAAIAAFLVLRLRSVLGRRSGNEQAQKYDPFRKRGSEEASEDKVIALPERGAPGEQQASGTAGDGSPLEQGLTQIKLADRNFEPDSFVNGAKVAFEMIVTAFAAGDTKTLRPLLSNDVFGDFSGAIKARLDNQETLESTLVGITEAEIIEAELQGKTAFVTIKFVSEQINVTRNADGEVVDGDPSGVATVTDIWTFARNTRSRDPNWTLVATGSSN
ncbi:MAG: Tim44/TimA family putative adaptor protein [Kiloniellales bacterium]|jgi:predicted lipid-binding transport protein (Tim44 family)|nr:Tim44/TimA family putative adaptor protein [Kiloniellales bacterium]